MLCIKRLSGFISILFTAAISACTTTPAEPASSPLSWGDQGNGTYINPILLADYSDPDITRVGDTYYMVASDFHFMGMQILQSIDLVNWSLVSQLYKRIDADGYDSMNRYAAGSWAPSIRHHNGKFYVFFCTPTEGLYMTSADSAEGPWSNLLLVHEGTGPGWEDPCPFWDDDGQAYLGRSYCGAGPIIIHKMSPDGTRLLDDGVEVYRGPIAEGTKIHKWDGVYYLSIPEGGVGQGWQTILRSKNIYGPYERKIVLETGMTGINGPHQGAIVDTPRGEWWFLHFQQHGALGRVVHLQPMYWADGWPVIGVDIDRNGIGEPVYCWKMPYEGTTPSKPATSDDFSGTELGLQWQFNHNPVEGSWSLTQKPGRLTMHALKADSFRKAHGTISQKLMGYTGTITVRMDLGHMADGQRCGLGVFCNEDRLIGLECIEGNRRLFFEGGEDITPAIPFSGKRVWLRLDYDVPAGNFQLSWSTNGKDYTPMGTVFHPRFADWKGSRPALFNYNTLSDGGEVSFDDFTYDYN